MSEYIRHTLPQKAFKSSLTENINICGSPFVELGPTPCRYRTMTTFHDPAFSSIYCDISGNLILCLLIWPSCKGYKVIHKIQRYPTSKPLMLIFQSNVIESNTGFCQTKPQPIT